MIKKLSLKFVLVFLVLVVSVFITSSCYASETFTYEDIYNITIDESAKTVTIENTSNGTIKSIDCSTGFNNYSQYYIMGDVATTYPSETNFYVLFSNSFSWNTSSDYISNKYAYVNLNDLVLYNIKAYDTKTNITLSQTITNPTNKAFLAYGLVVDTSDNVVLPNYKSNHDLIYSNHTIFGRSDTSKVLYAGKVDTSFDYSFKGVKRGQTKLSITNLDSSLRMYGYVGLDTTFSIGDTLDITSNLTKLRLMASKSDNSDLLCYLSHGEEINYYIVDENNVILDSGYISEMAKGYFLYGFNVVNGVDYVFLKDGQVYWDNTLDFKYKTLNSNTIHDDSIVSISENSFIVKDINIASGVYIGYVYDSYGNLLAQADCNYINDLSSFSIKVDTSYYEVESLLKHYSCYWLQTIYLTGNNKDGTSIDFSDYYINWSVPAWVDFDKIELGTEEYNKRSGTLTGFTSEGVLSMFNLKLYEYLNVHTQSFDITLQVYDGNGNLVLTHIINSDNIVRDKIASEENNVDKGDYGILDNPGYTGGSNNSSNIGNIQNWTADDYLNLMSTDNFIWEFFKAILGNLPWWITTPLTILIFGVVIITLIRFARGA